MFLSMPDWIFGAKYPWGAAHFSDGRSYDFALFSVHGLDFFFGIHWAKPEALRIGLELNEGWVVEDRLTRFVEADDI